MKNYIVTLLIYLLCFGTQYTFGQESDSSSPPVLTEPSQTNGAEIDSPFPNNFDSFFTREEAKSDDFRSKFANMLLILGLLIAFMLVASWAIKRMMKNRTTQLNSDSYIKVLETRYLSPKSSIHLIEVLGQGILIGESNAGIHQLAKIQLSALEENEPITTETKIK